MDGKELLSHITSFRDNLQKYLETKLSYFGILAFEKAVKVVSIFMAGIFFLLAGVLALLFISGAISIYIGGLLGSYWQGMLIVGGVYFIVLLVMIAWRKRIFGRASIRMLLGILVDEDEEKER